MAFLQHGAACIRGLAPLSRAAASASRRSSHHAKECSDFLIRGSLVGGADQPSSSAKQEVLLRSLHEAKTRPPAELRTAFKQEISVPREQAFRQAHSSAGQQAARGGQAEVLTAQTPEAKSIADIYGPYEPLLSAQAKGVAKGNNRDQAEAVSLLGGVDKVTDNEGRVLNARRLQTSAIHAEPARSSPEIVHPTTATLNAPASSFRPLVDDSAESVLRKPPSLKRIPLEVNASTNLTSSVGVAPPLPPPPDSDNSAYAAFSAFAVLPLLLVLILSWVTYSSYRSKRRPLEIRVGGQDSGHSRDLETGNGKSKQSSLIQQIVERLPQLREVYKPYLGLTNRHVETIFAAFFRKLPNVQFRRECLAAPDGGTVALDWPVHGGKKPSDEAMWGQELPAGSPVLILLPGLTGGSGDTYVRHMLVRARRAGFHTVVFNSRGCADSPVTSPQFYSASFTDDMRMVAAHVQQRFPDSKLLAMGWSLGANILVRYLGQEGPRTPIAAAASLCNPFDLVKGDEGFRRGFGKVYDQSLAKSLNRIFKKHAALFEGIGGDYNIPLVATAKTVRDFDEGLTRVCFGFPSVDEYYRQSSSINNIQDVAIPLMCIQAEDDPIAPNEGIPREKIQANPNTFLVVTPAGGHLGWIAGEEAPLGAPWTDPLVMDFFKTFLELQPSGRRGTRSAEQEVERTLQEVGSSGEEALELSQSWNKR